MTQDNTDIIYRTDRDDTALRSVHMTLGFNPYAEGSCLIEMGDTHVVCNATFENRVPPFLRGQGKGWITAEYGMLPRSTHNRMHRKKTLESGRTQEIQRLIGRSLRAVVDTHKMGETQVLIDCDVIQADGGTRTAAITGAFVALQLAQQYALDNGLLCTPFIVDSVSAISCGIVGERFLLDLEYTEDSNATADANFVLTGSGNIVEVQATAEQFAFSRTDMNTLFELAQQGCRQLRDMQQHALQQYSSHRR